jgi:hypothetical protein
MSLRQHIQKVLQGNEKHTLKDALRWAFSWEGVKVCALLHTRVCLRACCQLLMTQVFLLSLSMQMLADGNIG